MASSVEQPQRHVTETETRLVLVGRTGEGKSATGNSILGRKEFDAKKRAGTATSKCNMVKEDINGRPLLIVDTPGLFDTREKTSNTDTIQEIAKCLTVSSPGPHAFLLTISANRFTDEVVETIKLLRETFGEDVLKHSIVIITGEDQLEEEDTTLVEFLSDATPAIKGILKACDNRYIGFNNRLLKDANKNNAQVAALLHMVDNLVQASGFFLSAKYNEIEQKLLKEEAQRKEKIDQEYKPLIDKADKQIQELDQKIEESRRKAEEEAAKVRAEEEKQRKLAEETTLLDANQRKAYEKEKGRMKNQIEENEKKVREELERLEKEKKKTVEEKFRKLKEYNEKLLRVRDAIRFEAIHVDLGASRPILGTLGGAIAGGSAGAVVGTVVLPGVGTLTGLGVGALVGYAAGMIWGFSQDY